VAAPSSFSIKIEVGPLAAKAPLLQTLDGGNTWKARGASTRQTSCATSFFIDEQNGWMVCEVNAYQLKTKEEPRAYLMKTTDGGDTGSESRSKDSTLTRFSFAQCSAATGAAGLSAKQARSTRRTTPVTRGSLQSPTRRLLLGGIFVDDDRGWIVGAGATIIQTSDGGDTWYQSRLPQVEKSVRFTATSFVDNRKGWAVGSGGSVYRTINGGRTWQRQESTVDVDLFDVKFVDALEGWAVGAEGTIIHTSRRRRALDHRTQRHATSAGACVLHR
jgi:photosystem II stability/assembly factor-like uncharacterized protein